MTKRKIILVFSLLIVALISLNYDESNTKFVNQTKIYLQSCSKQLQVQLDSVLYYINQNDSIIENKEELFTAFKKARFQYKKLEFYADYGSEDIFKIPIMLDEKRNFYIEKFAFPILVDIEEILADENISKEKLKNYIKEFQDKNLQFYTIVENELVSASMVMEALKYNIIKIETMNITDFDCEATQTSVQDMIANLQSLDTCLTFLTDQVNSDVQLSIKKLQLQITDAVAYLKLQDYNSLDRLYFTKNYIQPISELFTKIHLNSGIPLNENIYTIVRAVNFKSPNIYNQDFINTAFYSVDKYRQITEQEIELGKKLFFDTRLSNDNKLSCASCHEPSKYFTDGLTTAITNKEGVFQSRNSPTVLNAVFQRNFFYDFRAKSLEEQTINVVHNPAEFNTNYDTIVSRLNRDTAYLNHFKAVYPYENPIHKSTINAAISAYEHSLKALNSKFDQFMRNEIKELTLSEKNGYNLFMSKAKCGTCHFAPTFFGSVPPFYSEMESEVLGVPKVWDTLNYVLSEDEGRYATLKFDFFKNSFKVSTIRNAEHTAPYMHNGSFKTLEDVLVFYNRGGGAAFTDVFNQTLSDKPLNLSDQEMKDIIAFIKSLTDGTLTYK